MSMLLISVSPVTSIEPFDGLSEEVKMKGSQLNRSQLIVGIALFIVGIALFIIGIALVVVAVLVVLFTDYPAAGAAAIGVPGLVLISGTLGLVLSATLGLVLGPTSRR